jgi:2-dehydro-3-deoxy-D-arabinonate dehydratase
MYLVRFRDQHTHLARVGVAEGDLIRPLQDHLSISELAALPLEEFRHACESAGADALRASDVHVLPPIDGNMEVWAAGVTYRWSRDARVEESTGFSAAYTKVYDADRPELFFKSSSWRVVGPGAAIAVRSDSVVDVPEPELALVVNMFGEIIGFSVCNDVSSRSIEGENPLYLPQAKVFLGGCALGPGITPVWEVPDPYDLEISMEIVRAGELSWSGKASTSQLKRRFEELIEYLFRADEFPHGVVLSTGTCLVPELPFSLEQGDRVLIEISGIGTLENDVVRGKEALLESRAAARP